MSKKLNLRINTGGFISSEVYISYIPQLDTMPATIPFRSLTEILKEVDDSNNIFRIHNLRMQIGLYFSKYTEAEISYADEHINAKINKLQEKHTHNFTIRY